MARTARSIGAHLPFKNNTPVSALLPWLYTYRVVSPSKPPDAILKKKLSISEKSGRELDRPRALNLGSRQIPCRPSYEIIAYSQSEQADREGAADHGYIGTCGNF